MNYFINLTVAKGFCFFLIFFLFNQNIEAQIGIGGYPPSYYIPNLSDSIPSAEMPAINIDSLMVADSIEESQGQSFRFGFAIDVDLGLNNAGAWDTLTNGDKIWRLAISAKDAFSINLIYDNFLLPDGALFYIYSPVNDMILGGFTSMNNLPHGKFSTDLVKGNSIILELYLPSFISEIPILNVDKVIHGYKNTFFESGAGQSLSCNIDVNCPQGADWCIEKNAVAMILLADNTRWCSGALINNTNQDLTPYFLSANHCSQGTESTWLFRFKYWNSFGCNSGDTIASYVSISGSALKAYSANSDFLLLQLSTPPPVGFGITYAGWDRTSSPAASTTVIHHPSGDLMKISFDNDPPTSSSWSGTPVGSHWNIILDNGTTEGGSSGAPLFNQNHRIVGQNHGGDPGCPPISKFYGKFDVSWNNGLKAFLDPNNTGLTSVGPTSRKVYVINKTFTGVHNLAAISDMQFEGNVTINSIFPPPFADNYCAENEIPLTAESGSNVEIKASGRIILKGGVHFKQGSRVHISGGNVTCSDNIINGDLIDWGCMTNASLKTLPQYSYLNWPSNDDGNIFPLINENSVNSKNLVFSLSPNPTSDKILVSVTSGTINSIEVLNVLGQVIFKSSNPIQKSEIDFSNQPKGIYLVKMQSGEKIAVQKVIFE